MLVPGRSDEVALAALRLSQPRNASVEVSPRPLRGTGTHRRPRGATLGEGLTNGTRRPVELNLRAARFPSVRIPTATDSERNGTERGRNGSVPKLTDSKFADSKSTTRCSRFAESKFADSKFADSKFAGSKSTAADPKVCGTQKRRKTQTRSFRRDPRFGN